MTILHDETTKKETIITHLDVLDQQLDHEYAALDKVNGGEKRSDNSVILQKHLLDTRNLVLALRERLWLIEHYKERLG